MWLSLGNKDKRGEFSFEGGLNTGPSSYDVKDNQTINEYGWDTEEYPALKTRKGRSIYGTSGGDTTWLLTHFANTHLVRAVGTKLQYNSSGTTWTNITGTFTETDWDAANFDVDGSALILTNGTDNVKYWDGSTLSDLNADDAPKGKYIATNNIRVYIADGDLVKYCAFLDATDWTTSSNAGTVQVYTANGGDITALHSFEGHIWVFKKDYFGLIFLTGDSRATHRLVDVSNEIGCVSFKTVVEVGRRLFWLGQNEVYMGAGGNAIGIGRSKSKNQSSIDSYLNGLNPDAWENCFGGTDGIRYYLGLCTGSNTKPNVLLVYDPRYEIWRVNSLIDDLRYATTLNNVFYCGGDSGKTYKMNSDTDDDGTDISFLVETKDFDMDDPEAEKEFYELYMQVVAPTGTTLTVETSTDLGTNYTTIEDEIDVSASIQSVPIIIPLDTVDLSNWIRFRFSGTGQFTISKAQVYFRVQPVQI